MSSINSVIGGYAVGFRPNGHAHGHSRFRGFGDGRTTQSTGPNPTSGAQRVQGTQDSQPVQHTSIQTRTKSVSDSSTLSLTITTAEGDTVQLSVEAQRVRQSERGVSRTQNGVTRSASQSQQQNLSASVSVKGNLNPQELSDIQKLLDSIASGQGPDLSSTGSLSSYDYSLTQSHQVNVSNVAVYA